MAKKEKKSLIKKVLRIFLGFLVLLIGGIIAIPYFFKDEIREMALTEAEKYLYADIELKDFNVTFLTSFPKLKVQFDGLELTGQNEFDGVQLVNLKSLSAEVDFWSVMAGDKIEIEGIYLNEPMINVSVLQNGLANYDIVKPDSVVVEEHPADTASHFVMNLKAFEIINGDISYKDAAGNMFMELMALNIDGSIGIDGDLYKVNTNTSMDALSFNYDGIDYMSKVKTKAKIALDVLMNDEKMKISFAENEFQLNELKTSLDGYYEMLSNKDEMDIKLVADKTEFKDLLSLVPAFYTTGYEKMATGGKLSMNAWVKGSLDEENLPGWDMSLMIDEASINYPDLPEGISNINIAMNSKFEGGSNLDKMTLDIDKFTAKFVGNTLDANLKLRNVMTDPYIKSKIFADVDLASLDKVIPMEEGESYTGQLKSNLILDGRYSSIENEKYDEFKASGDLLLTNMLYKSSSLPAPVEVENLSLAFTPEEMKLTDLKAKMGKSDFNANGDIDNYLGYALKDEPLKGSFTYSSKVLDMDDLMTSAEGESIEQTPADTTPQASEEVILIPGNIDFTLNAKIAKLLI